ASRPALIHRVSLLGRTPDGPRVLSDVTTSLDARQRPACIGRLTASILRTARQLGDIAVFEPSGERLWREIQGRLERLLSDFHAAGALAGATAAEAYQVRCDASTTSQNDLDNGRVVAEVRFAPSHPVGLITVVLSLREGQLAATASAA
ncbi:MAG: phage tail sheath protein, partial [Burkholderiales bacterium]|nr:phage tail sheath protein [Opitutaceae bacterium]